MKGKDQIKDLFSEKLGNFEAPVNPELWANVASQVGAASGAAATGGGLSLLAKAVIGISGAAVLTTGVVLWTGSDSETETKETPKKEIAQTPSQDNTIVNSPVITPEPVASNNQESSNSNGILSEPTTEPIGPTQVDPIVTLPNPTLPDPVVGGPTDPVVNNPNTTTITSATSLDEEREALQEARKKDSLALVQPNVAQQDEPVNTINPVVVDPNIVQAKDINVVFPDIFSPNGDGWNDTYFIKSKNVEFEAFEFVVYDRRGSVVMISKDANFKWTAMDPQTGRYLEKGMYAYVMIGETVDGIQCKKSGTISITE